jgi:hypothetical protein
MTMHCSSIATAVVLSVVVLMSGCGERTLTESTKPSDTSQEKQLKSHGEAGHSHEAAHGGIVNSVGDFHVELVLNQKTSKIIAYISGDDGATPKYLDAEKITAQIKREGSSDFSSIELLPIPEDSRQQRGARFEAVAGDLVNASDLEVFLRIPADGKQMRTVFQVTPGKSAKERKTYICPMKCEKDKVYPAPGKCPVCSMSTVEYKENQIEHADHTAKHGGTFFMAADNWHHLEGVMASPSEFRLYIYDNFTHPTSAKDYEGTAEIVRQDAKGNDFGAPVTLSLTPSPDGAYLKAALPAEYPLPLFFTVRVTLQKGEKPALFNFTFDKVGYVDVKK